ncbi:MAG: TrkH family potassium uptake protein [Actinomycetia bacterium]|nr:TrkH family potassium uptake protein [Actinomycetes bacterium]
MKELPLFSSKTQNQIAKQVLLAFLVAIFIGSLVLLVPQMTASGQISYIDALFTSTSAICVTGLIVQDTPTYFTDLGKTVILILIQLGGLGIMTVGSIFGLILGRKISIRDKFYLTSSFGRQQSFSTYKFFMLIASVTFAFEFIGFLLMSSVLYFKYSYPIKSALTFSGFHSISAFNNAGFSLYSNSLEGFAGDIPINLVVVGLIIIGGLGFPVISEIITYRRTRQLSLHAKLVLIVSGSLLAFGAIMFFLLEFRNPDSIGGQNMLTKILASIFQSVTPRTAGFNTISMAKLNPATLFFIIILMFIGASPGSTGGGIKTTTFAVVTAGSLSTLRGREQVTLFKRRIPNQLIRRALTITITVIVLVIFSTIGILILEKCTLVEAIFEVISAFGTVGLSTGITFSLSVGSKIILILCMFIGRIGISTLSVAIAIRGTRDKIVYPEETVTIG